MDDERDFDGLEGRSKWMAEEILLFRRPEVPQTEHLCSYGQQPITRIRSDNGLLPVRRCFCLGTSRPFANAELFLSSIPPAALHAAIVKSEVFVLMGEASRGERHSAASSPCVLNQVLLYAKHIPDTV